jgi:hypothetical protein
MVAARIGRVLAVTLLTVAAVAGFSTSSAHAFAAPTCESTILDGGGVGGITIYVAGNPVRVPKIENIDICAEVGFAEFDLVPANVYSWGCGSPCFDVFTPVWTGDGSARYLVCFTADGERLCSGVETDPTLRPGSQQCVLSFGRPAQQTPSSCLVVVDWDTLLGATTGITTATTDPA